jgi:cytochrome c553
MSKTRPSPASGRASRASRVSIPSAAMLLLAATTASAQLLPHGQESQGEALAKNVCAACHRADGNSVDPDYPKLAGQSARYLYDQLLAFKAQGHRRASGVMGAMAVNLTDAEMRDVSAYFAAQLPRDTGPQNVQASPKLLAQGQSIYRQGIGGKAAVPACASCHALSGAGLPPEFPRLAGQHEQYLVNQLAEFRSDRRNSDPSQMMSVVAHKLSDTDIQAVAAYIARMRSRELAAAQ